MKTALNYCGYLCGKRGKCGKCRKRVESKKVWKTWQKWQKCGKVTKVWKTRKVKTELKSNKSADNPDSNRPINLLCIPYKLFERLIYNRIKSVIKSVLPKEQASFRPNHYTLDQVALLQPSFDKKLKTGVVLVDLSAAYDTIWHCGLTLKLLKQSW